MNENMKSIQTIERKLMILEQLLCDVHDQIVEKKVCPVCEQKIRLYLPFGVSLRKNAQCPVCKTVERHRFMWLYFKRKTNIFATGGGGGLSMLHFAPEFGLYNEFSKMSNIDYYPVDFNPSFHLNLKAVIDIQNISYEDNKFDVIICSHVLEHIPNDRKAIQELYRVLKPGGTAYIMVPISNSDTTYEAPAHNTTELRLQHYGQGDHVRQYGKDFIEKLALFDVKAVTNTQIFSDDEIHEYSMMANDQLFVCIKQGGTQL